MYQGGPASDRPDVPKASERTGKASTVTSREVDAAGEGQHAPDPPPAAVAVFGAALGTAVEYGRMLAGPGVHRGLIGPHEVVRIWDRHLLNCAVVAELVPEGATVCDIGSGAGLPGIALAIARPDLRVILLEPLLRRSSFLRECVDALGLDRLTVDRGRAEERAGQIRVDVATARAVAPLPRLAGWALPLLRPGGELLALKGQSVEEELSGAEPDLRRLGAADWSIVRVGSGTVDPPTTVVRVRSASSVRTRAGEPSRRQHRRRRDARGRRP